MTNPHETESLLRSGHNVIFSGLSQVEIGRMYGKYKKVGNCVTTR